jgi:hypothetical protein
MNTGIQDMMNLAWKLALVLKGHASSELLDTYQQDRMPVMRSILSGSEGLTKLMSAENPLVRGLFNHLVPWIGGMNFVEENATARISQIALNYRDSPLSADHAAGGSVCAGDRIPELRVRAVRMGEEIVDGVRTGHEECRLFDLLNPSRFTLLLVNCKDRASLQAQLARSLEPFRDLISVVQIQPPDGELQKNFRESFGSRSLLILIRPDAYVGYRGNQHSLAKLGEYCRHWFSPDAVLRAA